MSETIYKTCNTCHKEKVFPLDFFKSTRWVSGYMSWCKKCHYEKTKVASIRYQKTEGGKAKHRKQSLEWRKGSGRVYSMWAQAKDRAKSHNIPFDIQIQDIVIPTECPVFHVPFNLEGTHKNKENSPSLDRIIPELGYVKGNIIVVCWRANRLKNDGTPEEHINIGNFYQGLINGTKSKGFNI